MIEARGLVQTFLAGQGRKKTEVHAVAGVDLDVAEGEVVGFLGPNGAGKSTTMRMMVGLTPPSSGTSTVCGARYADLPNPPREVGVLLDASAQHAGRTGREILAVAAQTAALPRRRVDEMLELVSLTGAEADRRVRNYSLGMRQRLGIAVALVGDPEVLILDEPANGLDPAGIRWMRDLLRGFAARGGTVLLSSHLLGEIEVIADDIVVIGRGRVVAEGTKAELLAQAGSVVSPVEPSDAAALVQACGSAGLEVVRHGDGALRVDADPRTVGLLAHAAGVPLAGLQAAGGAGLEETFLQLTADVQREAAPPHPSAPTAPTAGAAA